MHFKSSDDSDGERRTNLSSGANNCFNGGNLQRLANKKLVSAAWWASLGCSPDLWQEPWPWKKTRTMQSVSTEVRATAQPSPGIVISRDF